MAPQKKRMLAWLVLLAGLVNIADSLKLCNDPKFDTIFSTPSGKVYVFKDNDYWELSLSTDGDGYNVAQAPPQTIQSRWQDLPGNLEASFTNFKTGLTYFMKGSQVWMYNDLQLQPGFPKLISQEFPGIPNDVDLAFMCTGSFYFFKGDKYWGFNSNRKAASGPYSITGFWRGLANNMHAVLQLPSGGYHYFFKDLQYYKFKISTFAVDVADPPYPHDTETFWFDCQDEREYIINEPTIH